MELCKVYGCNYKRYHKTEGHTCSYCGKKGHGKVECNNILAINYLKEYNDYDKFNDIKKFIDINNIKNIYEKLNDGDYTHISLELGSQLFIRKIYKYMYQYLIKYDH